VLKGEHRAAFAQSCDRSLHVLNDRNMVDAAQGLVVLEAGEQTHSFSCALLSFTSHIRTALTLVPVKQYCTGPSLEGNLTPSPSAHLHRRLLGQLAAIPCMGNGGVWSAGQRAVHQVDMR
jgi:hypothetical protein